MKFNRVIHRATAIALAAGSALYAAPHASAADNATKPENPKFVKLDRNRDGVLTRDEVGHIRGYDSAFTEADANRDARLDQAEFIKAEAIHDRLTAAKYVDDSLITAKVKAALLKEPELKSLEVSVETLRGEVLLSGFVRNEGQRQKAMKAAVAVGGVTSVKDALVVR